MLGTAVPSVHYNFQLAYNIIKCQSKVTEQNLISNPTSGTIPEDCFFEWSAALNTGAMYDLVTHSQTPQQALEIH